VQLYTNSPDVTKNTEKPIG